MYWLEMIGHLMTLRNRRSEWYEHRVPNSAKGLQLWQVGHLYKVYGILTQLATRATRLALCLSFAWGQTRIPAATSVAGRCYR